MAKRGRPFRFDPIKDAIIAYYQAGHTLDETAAEFGFSPSGISNGLKKFGIEIRKRDGTCVLDPVRDQVIADYQSGLNLAEVAARYGCGEGTVRRFLTSIGVETRNRGKVRNPGYGDEGWFCPGCNQVVAWDGWGNDRRGNGPRQHLCKSCLSGYRKTAYTPEQLRQYAIAKRPSRNARNRRNTRILREEVIRHYGGQCACCSESAREFLALDHINGGGNQHKRELFAAGIRGALMYYRWIKEQGFPPIYRVLCHNCNMAKGHFNYCPHEPRPFALRSEPATWGGIERARRRAIHRRFRKRVLKGYGGACQCCGESVYEFLALDHVNGGGGREARENRANGIGPINRLRNLIREGFPPGLRVLCHNCNSALGFYGTCPHVCSTHSRAIEVRESSRVR